MVGEKAIYEALGHLGAALAQSISTDDQVIVGHIREAYRALGGDPSRYVGYPYTTLDKSYERGSGREGLVVRKGYGKTVEAVVFPWTRVSLNIRILRGEVVDRYELWPLGPEHIGIGGILRSDVGRRLVVEYSVSNKSWIMVDRIVDLPQSK